jgi:hypothetical protein
MQAKVLAPHILKSAGDGDVVSSTSWPPYLQEKSHQQQLGSTADLKGFKE